MIRNAALSTLTAIALSGCATWSTSHVDTSTADAQSTSSLKQKQKHYTEVQVLEEDITDRAYMSLGDISATVNKTTIFHPDPTKEMVAEKLREKAADMGADAVVLARYGKPGISLISWGSMEGKGRAIKFNK